MSPARQVAKVVAINFALVSMVVGLFVAGPIVLIKAYDAFRIIKPLPPTATYHLLPNYRDIEWAAQYSKDQTQVQTTYVDFTIWEFDALTTATINIDEQGHRHTVIPKGAADDEVWMFGGSTTYGTGVDDAHTIPSLLASRLSVRAVNNGTDSYIARQNVNRLLREYEVRNSSGHGKRTIIFFDGINDIYTKCRVENPTLGSAYQNTIQSAMEDANRLENASPMQLLWPAKTLFNKISLRLRSDSAQNPEDLYVCDNDADRADRVARALVGDWSAAQSIAEANGDSFVAFLQPFLLLSNTRADHLFSRNSPFSEELLEQFNTVYPLIRSRATADGVQFHDLTHVLDHDEFIYIDLFHVSPNGNEYLAQAMAKVLP